MRKRTCVEMRQLEARKAALVAEVAMAAQLSERVAVGRAEILGLVEAAVKDYRGLLAWHTTQARAILRELLVDRVLYGRPRGAPGGAGARSRRWAPSAACSAGPWTPALVAPRGSG